MRRHRLNHVQSIIRGLYVYQTIIRGLNSAYSIHQRDGQIIRIGDVNRTGRGRSQIVRIDRQTLIHRTHRGGSRKMQPGSTHRTSRIQNRSGRTDINQCARRNRAQRNVPAARGNQRNRVTSAGNHIRGHNRLTRSRYRNVAVGRIQIRQRQRLGRR